MRIWLLSGWLIALGCARAAGSGPDAGDAAVAGETGAGGTAGGNDTGGAPPDGGSDGSPSTGVDAIGGGGTDALTDSDASTGVDASVGDGTDVPMGMDASIGVDASVGDGMDVPTGGDTSTGADARDAPADVRDAFDAPAGTVDAGPLVFGPWPGANVVAVVDGDDAFGTDVSGLAYQPAAGAASAILWAVNNNSGKLYRLTWNGSIFTPVTTEGWQAGKALRYPNGDGSPDTEGVTKAEWESSAVYVVAERDNDDNGESRMSVLRYDATGTATTLTATHEWNLTPDLPEADANKGLEGITWIPDSVLVAKGFFDETAGKIYAPSDHPNHGTGLFFVALETDGRIHVYALNHTAGTFRRVASIASGQEAVMDLAFDRDVGTLWSSCDETCDNRVTLLDVDQDPASPTRGRFRVRRGYAKPGTLPNEGNEGIAIAPESECAAGNGKKAFLWADDSNTDDHAIRRDLIPCGILY